MNANESYRLCAETIHPFGGLANTGSALNIRVYLRSSAADCFFQVYGFFNNLLAKRHDFGVSYSLNRDAQLRDWRCSIQALSRV